MTAKDFISPFSRSECVRLLRERARPGHTVAGNVGNAKFRLHKVIGYRNSFQTHVRGRMEDHQSGTRIHCRFGLHPFVAGFIIVWLGVVAFVGLTMLVSGKGVGAGILLFPLAGAGILLVGRTAARNEEEFLTNYLQKLLEARAS